MHILLAVLIVVAVCGGEVIPDFDVLVVLGSAIVRVDNAILPGPSGEIRCAAAVYMLENAGERAAILSGGYLVGVRYKFDPNELMNPPNTSIAAFSTARMAYPSEASTFARFLKRDTFF